MQETAQIAAIRPPALPHGWKVAATRRLCATGTLLPLLTSCIPMAVVPQEQSLKLTSAQAQLDVWCLMRRARQPHAPLRISIQTCFQLWDAACTARALKECSRCHKQLSRASQHAGWRPTGHPKLPLPLQPCCAPIPTSAQPACRRSHVRFTS